MRAFTRGKAWARHTYTLGVFTVLTGSALAGVAWFLMAGTLI
jgi:hypothetical protein